MIPPPPRSTLFPYTTLFRSFPPRHARAGTGLPSRTAGKGKLPGDHLDRKSTRLNSSHTVISYAVFCLKKKKKNKTTHSSKETRNANYTQYTSHAQFHKL